MSYQLEAAKQTYGSQEYLIHNIKGASISDDRFLFGMRVQSYGIINFGSFTANQTKNILPSAKEINSDIQLRSLYPFTLDGTKGEITFRLLQGTTKIAEWLFSSSDIPFRFPEGAIINPAITLEIKFKYAASQILIYWQPVYTLSYITL